MEYSIQSMRGLCSKSQGFPRIKSCVMEPNTTMRTDACPSTVIRRCFMGLSESRFVKYWFFKVLTGPVSWCAKSGL